jgi:hypothetical protein
MSYTSIYLTIFIYYDKTYHKTSANLIFSISKENFPGSSFIPVEFSPENEYNEEKEGYTMQIELSEKQFRRLLDMVYIGNWILNSTRGTDRFHSYDEVESLIFSYCKEHGMEALAETWNGTLVPSRAFAEGGIHEAIMDYEDAVFFDILAEELARRDMDYVPISAQNYDELVARMDEYMEEFQQNGTDRLQVEDMD